MQLLVAKLVILSQILQKDLTELITGKEPPLREVSPSLPTIDYQTLSAITNQLTDDDLPLYKPYKLILLESLLEVIQTKYVDENGQVFEKYLLKNMTKDERAHIVKILHQRTKNK